MILELITACVLIENGALANLYPHGVNNGDTVPTKTDDGSILLNLNTNINMFSNSYSSLYINFNGVISLGNAFPAYDPEPFPVNTGSMLIALFWADMDVTYNGKMFYRETTDAAILQRGRDDVQARFTSCHNGFTPTRAVIVTWKSVTYFHELDKATCMYEDPIPSGCTSVFGRRSLGNDSLSDSLTRTERAITDKTNHLQVVILTDGSDTFTIFNYLRLQWWTGDFSRGVNGSGGNIATVGFCRQDGGKSYSHPFSGTPNIVNLKSTSNVGINGRWIYKISQVNLFDSNCTLLT